MVDVAAEGLGRVAHPRSCCPRVPQGLRPLRECGLCERGQGRPGKDCGGAETYKGWAICAEGVAGAKALGGQRGWGSRARLSCKQDGSP